MSRTAGMARGVLACLELLCSNAHFVFDICPAVYQARNLAQLTPFYIGLHHVLKQRLNALSAACLGACTGT